MLVPQLQRVRRRQDLRNTTVRDFSGGLNVSDNDLNLDTSYSVIADNVFLAEGGSQRIRYGTAFFGSTLDVEWPVPNNFTQITATSHTQSSDFSIVNPDAWHDANNNQPIATSTHVSLDASAGAISTHLTLEARWTAGQANPNLVRVYAPVESFRFGSESHVLLTCNVYVKYFEDADEVILRCLVGATSEPIVMALDTAFGKTVEHVRTEMLIELDEGYASMIGIAEVEFYTRDTVAQPGDAFTGYEVVQMVYFQNDIVTFTRAGRICTFSGKGVGTVIWGEGIAFGKGVDPWSANSFVSTTVFAGKLLAANGIDKPLEIDQGDVNYLVDAGSGSNANTPIGRYILTAFEYVLIAGDPLAPATVHISARGTAGTFDGDPDPNDAVAVDISKIAVAREAVITGLSQYRQFVVVTFDDVTVLGQLGIYDESNNHTPDFTEDPIKTYGSHSHRGLRGVESDLYMVDHAGVAGLSRTFFNTIDPARVSELVNPILVRDLKQLREGVLADQVWSLYDETLNQYMLFVPNADPGNGFPLPTNAFYVLEHGDDELFVYHPGHNKRPGYVVQFRGVVPFNTLTSQMINDVPLKITRIIDDNNYSVQPAGFIANVNDPDLDKSGGGVGAEVITLRTETVVYVYTLEEESKRKTWSIYRGWNMFAGTVSALGTVFLAAEYDIFVQGNYDAPVSGDFRNTCYEADVEFVWEFPWADFDERMINKHTRYAAIDSLGTASFTFMSFVDRIYRGPNGVLWPAGVLRFEGGGRGGYGAGSQPYGGGVRSSSKRLISFTTKGQIMKLRIQGATMEPLDIAAISLLYHKGNIGT